MNWITIENPQDVVTPRLVIVPERIRANIERLLEIAGGTEHAIRLWPHVKTHKMAEVVEMQVALGITKCKAATLAEAEMAAAAGATDVLVAHQLVGPKIKRYRELLARFPATRFSTVVDNVGSVQTLCAAFGKAGAPIPLWIDVDCGMQRSGIPFGNALDELRGLIDSHSSATFGGLHVYDGHIHDADLATRRQRAAEVIGVVSQYVDANPGTSVIAGGTPTYAIWAAETKFDLSPGTPILWDVGYGSAYPDLPFDIAGALATRVISKPGENRLCLDLGHKSVASEMALEKRVVFPKLRDVVFVGHSEEHLVLETSAAANYCVGDLLIAYPKHICPSVALHDYARIVEGEHVTEKQWKIVGRNRDMSVGV